MKIYKKLFEAKKEIGKISKDSENPFYKSKYFDVNALLEHVEPILQKNNLLVLQPIENGSVTTQIVDIESGEKISSSICLTNITDPQKRGSEITYYRRYSLTSLLGLQANDDDANTTLTQDIKKTKPSTNPTLTQHIKKIKPSTNPTASLEVGDESWYGALSKKTSLETLRLYFQISKANADQYTKALNQLNSIK